MQLQPRILSLSIILSSLFPYLSWGKGSNSAFLFEIEWQIFSHLNTDVAALSHPMVFVPIIGQLVILIFGVIYPKIPMMYLGILTLFILIGTNTIGCNNAATSVLRCEKICHSISNRKALLDPFP
ncbi:MAG: hypothetical protein ACKO4Y_00505, partial [Flavobacteriales bacterium]